MAKILLVEDDHMLNQAFFMILGSAGHTVVRTYNGKEAWETLRDFQPDIILLDMLMPIMSGLEFMQEFFMSPKLHSIKIVILTNLGKDHEVEEALALGANHYVLKAEIHPRGLISMVNSILEPR